ncbi:MAG TPA: GNAT family N-acetyltransferase [Actinomycetota bacterium]|nr:GNAT family N-acetyltransferase [Actinomycetota bacterium]
MRASRLIRETITLRDGRQVVLRAIRPEDAPGLIEFHQRLSPESRYFRFFGPKPELSPEEARYLAEVDFSSRFAIVAVQGDEILGVGRFDLVGPGTAEAAVVVRDDHQGHGIGRALLERLLEVARGRGIERLAGEILADNDRMLDLLRGSESLDVTAASDGVVQVTVPISDGSPVFRTLSVVAKLSNEIASRAASLKRRGSPDR